VTRGRVLVLVLALSGCAMQPPRAPPAACPYPACTPAAVTDWRLQGRLSLTRGAQGWHASLDWQDHAGRYRLLVRGPLGQGALQLDGDAQGVRLTDAEGRVHVAADAESLLQQVAGWRLPVSGLRYWVRGLPYPGVHLDETLDDTGRLAQLRQAGWTIRYQRFRVVDGIEWPDRLTLERDDLVLKLVIDQWRLGPGPAS
jgi:outer membrane lipoprotein LolB